MFFAMMRIIYGTAGPPSKTPGGESLQYVLKCWSIDHQQGKRQRVPYTHFLLKSDAGFMKMIS